MPSKHLWEVERECSCEEGNWFKSGEIRHAASWDDFTWQMCSPLEPGHPLLIRWDWEAPTEDTDTVDDGPIKFRDDPYYRESTLRLHYLNQSKGWYFTYLVSVCRADEQAVREFLKLHLLYMVTLWQPLEAIYV